MRATLSPKGAREVEFRIDFRASQEVADRVRGVGGTKSVLSGLGLPRLVQINGLTEN